jgi:hypothetical protein
MASGKLRTFGIVYLTTALTLAFVIAFFVSLDFYGLYLALAGGFIGALVVAPIIYLVGRLFNFLAGPNRSKLGRYSIIYLIFIIVVLLLRLALFGSLS